MTRTALLLRCGYVLIGMDITLFLIGTWLNNGGWMLGSGSIGMALIVAVAMLEGTHD